MHFELRKNDGKQNEQAAEHLSERRHLMQKDDSADETDDRLHTHNERRRRRLNVLLPYRLKSKTYRS